MCQGCVPEYFEFKQSPAPLPQNWLNSRFLTQATASEEEDEDGKDLGTGFFEYRVAHGAPCPIIDAHVHGKPPFFFHLVVLLFMNKIILEGWKKVRGRGEEKKLVYLKNEIARS
jgi:hypothetical protein